MTYLSEDLDRICRRYCENCGTCPSEHECKERAIIRETIERILGIMKDDS